MWLHNQAAPNGSRSAQSHVSERDKDVCLPASGATNQKHLHKHPLRHCLFLASPGNVNFSVKNEAFGFTSGKTASVSSVHVLREASLWALIVHQNWRERSHSCLFLLFYSLHLSSRLNFLCSVAALFQMSQQLSEVQPLPICKTQSNGVLPHLSPETQSSILF